MLSRAVGREGRCKKITLVCVCSVSATLGLPLLTACVLSWSTLLRLQVALQGNCLKWALCCVRFPSRSCSGSGSRGCHKGTDSVGPEFCALPRSEQPRRPGAWQAHSPQVEQCILSPPPSELLSSLGAQQEHRLRGAVWLPCEIARGT